ncbi:long chain base biosynthesis protein 2d [Iris pallida]|uniref:Long chain base biosynthesis protein 2d n=1 Tax=Iris pallida TaxID=29817 RepID=A0AAX6GEJ6_IRIPA|nr:long chain base biosynthesis protein 2d [Iris pallida]KAJ6827176.1 long chain base biosynthesis protein 2d [Iris pallida]
MERSRLLNSWVSQLLFFSAWVMLQTLLGKVCTSLLT